VKAFNEANIFPDILPSETSPRSLSISGSAGIVEFVFFLSLLRSHQLTSHNHFRSVCAFLRFRFRVVDWTTDRSRLVSATWYGLKVECGTWLR